MLPTHDFLVPDPTTATLFAHDRTPTLIILPGDGLSTPVRATDSDRGLAPSACRRGDKVLIHPDDWHCVDWLRRHQVAAGLDPAEALLQPECFSQFPELEGFHLSPFIWNEKANLVQRDDDRLRMTRLANTKNWLVTLAERLKLRVPKTICCQNKLEFDLELIDILLGGYPVFLKISTEYSFTGNGVFEVADEQDLFDKLSRLSNDIPFQLQEDLRKKGVVSFPNLQYCERNGQAHRLLLTDQVLEGNEHCGNRHDPDWSKLHAKAWQTTDRLARVLARNGLKWIFAFDLAICEKDGRYDYYLVECNGRPNGSTYATAVAAKLPGYDHRLPWTAKTVPIKRPLEQIDLGPLLYQKERGYGLVPHIASTAKRGKLGVTFIGNPTTQLMLEESLAKILE